jgi:signal transduction histidine kinase
MATSSSTRPDKNSLTTRYCERRPVRDTGPGIPLGEQVKIFEEFHQVDNSATKTKGGTGLGLAIAKRIIEMHGGRISVESAPGAGSTFSVSLPVNVKAQLGPT